jgi:hypothetical protein
MTRNTRLGDYKVVWDRTKPEEVQAARDQFASWKKKGYMAYSVTGAKAEKGTVLGEFDPEAQSVIFAPALQGRVVTPCLPFIVSRPRYCYHFCQLLQHIWVEWNGVITASDTTTWTVWNQNISTCDHKRGL